MVLNETVKSTVFSVVGFEFSGKITAKEFDGVYVSYDGKDAVIGFGTKAQEARCYFLLSMEIKNGKTSFEITEKPAFKTCGPMLDMSRGGVMRPEAVMRYIDSIVALGMNMLMLYTEDTYEVEGYPMFGYRRGRYSQEELHAIDDYAYERGVEVIPCIQTLGHLMMYLRWPEGAKLSDTASVLMAGSEDTYAFIEAEISTMRKAFRSNRIHLGMDEAWDLGRGKYLKKNGYRDATTIIYEHLTRVLDIAKKYYEEPMIWSDMLFQSETGGGPYQVEPSQETVDNAPDGVTLVFWDYYTDNYDFYSRNLIQHNRFRNNVAFAGGVWTWHSWAPCLSRTMSTMKPAMQACVDHGVQTVIATKWGEDGTDCDLAKGIPGLAVFSEYCYKGRDCTDEEIYAASCHISGVDKELWDAISGFYADFKGGVRIGKGIFYSEPLYNLVNYPADLNEAASIFRNSRDIMLRRSEYRFSEYYARLFDILTIKAEVLANLRKAYENGDREYLAKAANEIFPTLCERYMEFYELFKSYWRADYKVNGFEVFAQRFGGIVLRMKYATEVINEYLEGKITRIEELEAEIVPDLKIGNGRVLNYMNTSKQY